jgi:regulatory protein
MGGSRLNCHDRALRLLSVRPRSRRELEGRLLRAGFEHEEVAGELARLQEVGLVDDARFAAQFAEQATTRRLQGSRAVGAALAAKGVDRRTIEEALAEVGDDDAERLDRVASRRAARLGSLPRETAYRRLVSFLIRRGYDASAARGAAARALDAPSAEDL